MNKGKFLWSNLRASFWFVPSLIVAASIALATILIAADSSGSNRWLANWPRIFGAGAAGAREMLSTIAGSMMTVVGVTFSMTLVTLALASSQYTSRILRNFMSDLATQVVLGIFAGIFTYCLIVLRTIRGGETDGFIPSLSISFAVVLAIGGVGVLIFFIHHIASSIQASNIIAAVEKETLVAVDRLFPQMLGDDPPESEEDSIPATLRDRQLQSVTARRNGYIQAVDNSSLLYLARQYKCIIRMERGIGDFVVQGAPLVTLIVEAPPDRELVLSLQKSFSIDRYRTVDQDPAFGVRQIVDMALRALSPGINDTTTAVMCVDHLTAILTRLAMRDLPRRHRHEDGFLRVIAIGPTFEDLLADSFDQIRESARGNVGIMLKMLSALQTIGSFTGSRSRRRALENHADWIAELADRTIASPHDRGRFERRMSEVRQELQSGSAGLPSDLKSTPHQSINV